MDTNNSNNINAYLNPVNPTDPVANAEPTQHRHIPVGEKGIEIPIETIAPNQQETASQNEHKTIEKYIHNETQKNEIHQIEMSQQQTTNIPVNTPEPAEVVPVVDLRTGHESLHDITDAKDGLTEKADELEQDFIDKVEKSHATN